MKNSSFCKTRNSKTTKIFPISQFEYTLNSEKIKYFRFVENNSFFHCLVLSFFEYLTTASEINSPKIVTRRLKCLKKFSEDSYISQLISKFIEMKNQEIIEILRNNFEGFLMYKAAIFCYFCEKKFQIKLEEDSDLDSFIFSNRPYSFEVICKVFGLEIIIFTPSEGTWNINPLKKVSHSVLTLFQLTQEEFCILYQDEKRSFKSLENDSEILMNSLFLTVDSFCIKCLYLTDESILSCSHRLHSKCLQKHFLTNCPECNKAIKKPCFICKALKPNTSSCPSNKCFLCHQCLVMFSFSLDQQDQSSFSCSCNFIIKINEITLKCIKCTLPRFLQDFVIVSCPDNHEFLCKACWARHLDSLREKTKSMELTKRTCPWNQMKISKISEVIYKILMIYCVACRKENCRFYGEFVCLDNCLVCVDCQIKNNKKRRDSQESCASCMRKMVKKDCQWKD